ncbi:hypothetical protein HKT18_07245 [Flavobacterium sp. IMCC34852]|uniref:Uncharacterized protein n=1 Tax=Flavobacterium rivulicola TaxID=2732161 RepID=A0A7Y3R9U8_9FLAO|nr:hypothetical protein [Flavobacterium sp. IMCC34852]NNT72007.1 hypothetical protein [Flavobacterium sp. IMCC34852]
MKYFKLLCLVVTVLCLQSCKITETLLVNEDGSGKFNYEMDASPLMEMGGGDFGASDDSKSKRKKRKGNAEAAEKKMIDSTFMFKELFADKQDSIAKLSPEEQERFRKMENFGIRILMNEDAKQMSYSLFSNFKSIEELKDMTSPVKTLKESGIAPNKGMTDAAKPEAQESSSTTYFYDGKTFKKIVSELESKEIEKQVEEEISTTTAESESQELDQMAEAMKELLGKSSYKVVYTFAKPVKKVSIPNAVLSEDKKTVTVDYLFEDYMKKPKLLDIEIEFE